MLRKLSVNAAEAFQGRGSSYLAFQSLGINVRSEGKIRKVYDIFRDVLDSLKGRSAIYRNQMLSLLVGSKGLEVGNMVKRGSAGIDQDQERLKKIFGTLDQAAIDRAEAFNSKWVEFKWTLKGL